MTMKYIWNSVRENVRNFDCDISQNSAKFHSQNAAEFRVVYQNIPKSAGSQKTTYVDTINLLEYWISDFQKLSVSAVQ